MKENEKPETEKQNSVEILKRIAVQVEENQKSRPVDKLDIVKDILGFFAAVALGYGWALLMLLIISFVTLGYLHMRFDRMLVWSGLFTAGIAVLYIIHIVRKYRR
ncbi:MAG: hypothetical protein MRZ49_07320 [Lachnospiraceae bacterium]|nr:hypothetical protein [Lachnospiraceae bacterium]